MGSIGSGRWQGDLRFGDDWALYVGAAGGQALHAHVALQLAIGLTGSVGLSLANGRSLQADAVLIGPMAPHYLHAAAGPVLLLYADPRGALGQAFRRVLGERAVACPQLAELTRDLVAVGASAARIVFLSASPSALRELAQQLLETAAAAEKLKLKPRPVR